MEFVFHICSLDTLDSKANCPIAARLRGNYTCAFWIIPALQNGSERFKMLPPPPLEKKEELKIFKQFGESIHQKIIIKSKKKEVLRLS